MGDAPRAFVVGHPIGHSRSPLIHRHWLSRYGLDATYDAIDVAPEDFAGLIADLRAGVWTGGNVTIPHKETAFAAVDRLDAAATAIGAVNTLWLENGVLVGGNTDAYGFSANLDQRLPGWRDGETAVVLGAGGACRAVVHALIETGYTRIDLANRTVERAARIADQFGDKVGAHPLDAASGLLANAELIVNTTSLGMQGQPPLTLDFTGAKSGARATDIVYVPLETPFLERARRAGLATCDGLGMLLHQAAPGFEHWFGRFPEVDDALRDVVLADLNAAEVA